MPCLDCRTYPGPAFFGSMGPHHQVALLELLVAEHHPIKVTGLSLLILSDAHPKLRSVVFGPTFSPTSGGTNTRTPKPSRSPHTLLQILHLHNLRRIDPLQHQLRHPIALLHLKITLRMVKEQHLHFPPIIRINDAGTRIDEVLRREARPRRDPSVGTFRRGDGEIGGDESLAPAGDGNCFGGIEVIAGSKGGAAGGRGGVFRELLDEQGRLGVGCEFWDGR